MIALLLTAAAACSGMTASAADTAMAQTSPGEGQIETCLSRDLVDPDTVLPQVDTPQLVQAVSNRFDRITVTWEPVGDADGYVVYRKAAGEADWTPAAHLDGDTHSWTDTDVRMNTRYTYTVSAFATVDEWNSYSGYDSNGVSAAAVLSAAQQLAYPDIPYVTADGKPQGATISSGGCGPASVCNLGNNLLGWNTDVPTIARIAVDSGARYNGGTHIDTLLSAVSSSYGGFTYANITDDNAVFADVQNGAMAIIHTNGTVGGTYNKLLANSGHFLCLLSVDGDTATIVDSCSYTDKWTENDVRKTYITQTNITGVVQCPLSALAEAADYYYVVYPS